MTAPHLVYSKKAKVGIEVHCDCPVYSSTPKVCQHCLAAAKDMGVLSDYLLWVGKIKGPALNLSNLIAKEEPQSSGQKGSTNHRKGVPKGKKKPVLKELNGISNEDSVTSFTTTSVLSPSSTCSSSSPFPLASMPYVPPTSVMSPMHLPLYNVLHSLYSPPPPYQVPANYYNQPTFNSPYYFNAYSSLPQSLPQSNANSSLAQPVSCYKALRSVLVMVVEVQFVQILLTFPLHHMTS